MQHQELNIVVDNGLLKGDEQALFFQGEPVEIVPATTTMFDLLVKLGAFPSKGQARKNWTRTGAAIPEGFSDHNGIGKARSRLTVFCPTAANLEADNG